VIRTILAAALLCSCTKAASPRPGPASSAEPIAGPPAAAPAAAPSPALVELFTSEGCSSCPPADAALAELAKDDDAIVLSFHVDYWDELGWRDRFARPEFTDRQRAYGKGTYTPQLVVGGTDFVAPRVPALREAVSRARARPPANVLSLVRDGDAVRWELASPQHRAWLLVATIDRRASSAVARGENRGRALEHVNVVRALASTPLKGESRGSFAAQGDVVVYVQDAATRAVLAAAQSPIAR
jgi:hypothetical protein